MTSVHVRAIVVCDHCGKMVKRKIAKEWHLTIVHVRARRLPAMHEKLVMPCDSCKEVVKRVRRLEVHGRKVHRGCRLKCRLRAKRVRVGMKLGIHRICRSTWTNRGW